MVMENLFKRGETLFSEELRKDSVFCSLASDQTIGNNSWTNVAWTKELWNEGGIHRIATDNEFIYLIKEGYYQVNIHIKWADDATSYRGVTTIVYGCTRGNSTISEGTNSSPYGTYQEISCILRTTTTDSGTHRFKVMVLQNSGGDLNLKASDLDTNLEVIYLGE